MKRTVYFLGNVLVKKDSLPVRLISKLKKEFPGFSFIHLDPTEEIVPSENQELILIDTVIGIDKVTKFNDLNHWTISSRNTVHDFDLPVSLGILKKLGRIKKVMIIGVPSGGKLGTILKEAREMLKAI